VKSYLTNLLAALPPMPSAARHVAPPGHVICCWRLCPAQLPGPLEPQNWTWQEPQGAACTTGELSCCISLGEKAAFSIWRSCFASAVHCCRPCAGCTCALALAGAQRLASCWMQLTIGSKEMFASVHWTLAAIITAWSSCTRAAWPDRD
jgi:hypothetical protein